MAGGQSLDEASRGIQGLSAAAVVVRDTAREGAAASLGSSPKGEVRV